jgi:hypothetical protein
LFALNPLKETEAMKKVMLTALMTLAFLLPAHAQSTSPDEPNRFELDFNPVSFLRQDGQNLWGGNLAFAMRRSDRLSYVADLSIHQTKPPAATPDALPHPDPFTMSAFRFGLRYYAPARGKLTPFGQVLAGGAVIGGITTTTITPDPNPTRPPTTKTTVIESSHMGVAFAAGGGVDYVIKRWLSWRVFQTDYSLIRGGGNTFHGGRLHTGAVFRFGH